MAFGLGAMGRGTAPPASYSRSIAVNSYMSHDVCAACRPNAVLLRIAFSI